MYVASSITVLIWTKSYDSSQDDTPARAEFLRSLKRLEPEEMLRKLSRPSPGTCTWINETKMFNDWRTISEDKLLWIWGVPGVGKTTATRYLLENLRRWLQRRETIVPNRSIVAFFFCSSRDWLRNNHDEVIGSLLYQILSQNQESFRYLNEIDLEEYVSKVKDDPVNSISKGSDYLWKALHIILQRSKETNFWIVIDALDELEPDSRTTLLRQMKQAIDEDLGQKIKLLFSDRVNPMARHFTPKVLLLEIETRNEVADDVRRFISTQVENLCTQGKIDWRYQTQIEDTLSQLSEGNFLHASLAWTNFQSGVSYWSPQVIKNRLESVRGISKEVTAYYCALLERIPEDSREVAKIGFTWVLGARKPLNVPELQQAVAVSSGQRSWADLVEALGFNFEVQFNQSFGYLLRIEPDRQVRFAHATIKELLMSSPQEPSSQKSTILTKFRIQESDIDAQIAKSCIIILSFRDFVRLRDIAQESLTDRIKDFMVNSMQTMDDLKKFDFSNFEIFEEDAQAQSKLKPKKSKVYDDMKDEDLGPKWVELKRTLSQASLENDSHTLLSYCVSYWNYHCSQGGSDSDVIQSLTRFVLLRQSHFFHLVAMLLGVAKVHRGGFWNQVDQFARTPPLHLVIRIGDYPKVVQNLIEKAQNVNGMDYNGWTPLVWAIFENRTASIEVLLAQDSLLVNPSLPLIDGPVHLACRGETKVEIIQRLLADPRIDVNVKGFEEMTILSWCILKPELEDIALSLVHRRDLDINGGDKNGTPYLDQVFHQGQSERLALKIIFRPDVPHNWFERTPKKRPKKSVNAHIWEAIEDYARESGFSFLYMASSFHWNNVEDLILDRSPRLALQAEDDGLNLLERYAFHGIEHRLLQIIDKLPQNLFSQDRLKGSKLLQFCAQQDWESVILQLRYKLHIDDSQVDESSRTLAHWASELNWASIPSLLKNKSVSWLNHTTENGRTALHVAVEHRNRLACESLLNAGADYMIRDRSHRLPVHIAAEQGHRAILALLLGCPIREYGKDRQGRDLLHFLVMWHSQTFIQQCISILQPKLEVFDYYHRSPLHYAAIFGNSGAIKALLSAGADPNRLDDSYTAPIHYAQSSGCLKGVEYLLRAGADSEFLDKFGRSSLHLALRSEDPELIDFVMHSIKSKSEDVRKKMVRQADVFGQTVLHRICLWTASDSQPLEITSIEEELTDSEVEEIEPTSVTGMISTKSDKYIRALRSLGARVNAQDIHGCTPLHTAAKTNNIIAVEALLRFRETLPSIEDAKECTPMDWAATNGHSPTIEALRRRGAAHSENWQTKLRPQYVPWQTQSEDQQNADELTVASL